MRPWVAVPNEAWVTVKCVHCQVCSQVLCAVNAGAAKRSAPIGQCQCHGLDAGATKGTDAVAAKGFALWDPLPNAKAGSEPVTCFSEIVASCLPWGACGCVRAVAWSRLCDTSDVCVRVNCVLLHPGERPHGGLSAWYPVWIQTCTCSSRRLPVRKVSVHNLMLLVQRNA